MTEYEDVVNTFDLKRGDRIWLSSEIIKLVLVFRKKGIKFDGNELINAFQRKIGEEGTIMIPVFSFDFSNKQKYDILHTKGVTGALGNIAMEREDFMRTAHPMHSFMVWGKDKDVLTSMTNRHSFGIDSPFSYCIEKHVKQVILGTDYVHGMTFIHYAETTCNVPYRFAKSFTGTYIDRDGISEIRTYDYAARRLEISPKECFNKIGLILENYGISHKIDLDGIQSYLIDLAKSYPLICHDIIDNQCSNIYDFNLEREKIFI